MRSPQFTKLLKAMQLTGARLLDPAGSESNQLLQETGKKIASMMHYFQSSNPKISQYFDHLEANQVAPMPLPNILKKHRMDFEKNLTFILNNNDPANLSS